MRGNFLHEQAETELEVSEVHVLRQFDDLGRDISRYRLGERICCRRFRECGDGEPTQMLLNDSDKIQRIEFTSAVFVVGVRHTPSPIIFESGQGLGQPFQLIKAGAPSQSYSEQRRFLSCKIFLETLFLDKTRFFSFSNSLICCGTVLLRLSTTLSNCNFFFRIFVLMFWISILAASSSFDRLSARSFCFRPNARIAS